MADSRLTALTKVSIPALLDEIYGVDVSDTTDDAAGSSRSFTLERLLGFALHGVCQGRLTTESGVAVSTSDRTSQSTLYYTPYNGNKISLYDGTRWKFYEFTERSLALSGLTSGRNYDVFIYDNAGTLTLELSAAWNSDNVTRTDALTTQDGIYVKSGSTTRRYLGTIRTTGTTTTEDSGASSPPKRFVWNAYNRVPRSLKRFESTASWNYTTDTWRQANNSTSNQVEIVNGLAEEIIDVSVYARSSNSSANVAMMASIGEDSTSSPSSDAFIVRTTPNGISETVNLNPMLRKVPAAGYHYYAWLERSAATGTTQWVSFVSGVSQAGILGVWSC